MLKQLLNEGLTVVEEILTTVVTSDIELLHQASETHSYLRGKAATPSIDDTGLYCCWW